MSSSQEVYTQIAAKLHAVHPILHPADKGLVSCTKAGDLPIAGYSLAMYFPERDGDRFPLPCRSAIAGMCANRGAEAVVGGWALPSIGPCYNDVWKQGRNAMPSPFPGMDPYLEDPVGWPDVHVRLIVAISRLLTAQVAPDFYVRVEQRVSIVGPDDPERRVIVPDLYLARSTALPGQQSRAGAEISTPTLVTVLEELELREHYVEIYDARNRAVVATLEVLSPVNKAGGSKQAAFLAKRRAVMGSPAHWIEIDLLRAGERPPEVAGKSDYYTLLKRGDRPGPFEVWYRNLRDALPTIAVPLRPPFADVPLDLQVALDTAYAEARYDDQLDYSSIPPAPPLPPPDQTWVAARVAEWRQGRERKE